MKLLEREGEALVFRMTGREKKLLERLLSFYPIHGAGEARLSRGEDAAMAEAKELLVESLREQRDELVSWISETVREGAAFVPSGRDWKLVLKGGDSDRLLQVLNELRVGSWVKLGRPDDLEAVAPSAEAALAAAPLHALMMLTGQFEMVLVRALQGELDPPKAEPE